MDAIFKALNDPARRALLDSLRTKDGQSLSDLEGQLDMTRFGVMKHLKVLEEASLVVTRKVGRFKYHYLNAVPLQEVIDRWIEPLLAKPTARAVTQLKAQLEGGMTMPAADTKPDFVMSTFINCTHDALWDALTRGDLIAQYHFASHQVTGTHEAVGSEIVMFTPDGHPMLKNRVITIDPKTRIEMDFEPHWSEDKTVSRCIYLVEPGASGMKLTIEHYNIPPEHQGVAEGWARFASGLKTWLETGVTHRFAMEGMAG